MNILLVIDNLGTGGAQRQMVNLALSLKERGHKVSFFCYSPGMLLGEDLLRADIPVQLDLKKQRFSISPILALRKLINAHQYDIVLSYLTTPTFYSLLAGRFINHHPRIIVSERFYDPQSGIGIMENIARQLYVFADHIVANSIHQAENLRTKYPRLKDRISTIYNGYDLEMFSPLLPKYFGQPIRILVIASISPYKNGLCLVRALNILRRESDQEFVVDWAGEQVMAGERLAYRQQMDLEITEYRLEKQWNWLGQCTDIPQLLRTHDVLVHPSYGEGLPNAVCEALACGCPVIVSNTLDHPRLVQDGVSGYLFDWRSPEDLARTMTRFARLSVEERDQMGQRARQFAESHLSITRYADKYEALFNSLIHH